MFTFNETSPAAPSPVPAISMTLYTPENDSQSNDDPQIFIAQITPDTYNATNGTLHLWRDNGTKFINTTNTTLAGDNSTAINVTFSVASLAIDEYYWNVEGCQGDGNGSNCSFATDNFTLEWIPFNNTGEEYAVSVFETDNETLYLNITTDATVTNIGAFLIYNETYYAADHSCSSGLCQIERELDIPLLENQDSLNENQTFKWGITLFGTFGTFTTNTTEHQQNITNINFTDSSTGAMSSVNYTILNESTLAATKADFDGTFRYYLGSGTVHENASFDLTNANTYRFYINQNETFNVNASITITNSSALRNYFFLKENYTNISIIQNLLLPHDDTTNIIIEVKDQGLIPLDGYLVEAYRFYPDTDRYELALSGVTDEFGQVVGKLVEDDVKYRFLFYDQDRNLQKTSEDITIACRSSICIVPFIIEDAEEFFDRFGDLSLFSYDFEFSNTTNTFTLSWDDQRQEGASMRLEVVRYQFNQSTVVCNSTSTATVSSLTCAVGNQRASYKGQVFRILNDDIHRIAILTVQVGSPFSDFGVEGLLWVFILLFTAIGIGAFNPVAGASLYGAGFLICGIIGLISMPLPVFFANTLIVALFIWAVRT